jgi:hypothetical protein
MTTNERENYRAGASVFEGADGWGRLLEPDRYLDAGDLSDVEAQLSEAERLFAHKATGRLPQTPPHDEDAWRAAYQRDAERAEERRAAADAAVAQANSTAAKLDRLIEISERIAIAFETQQR